MRSLMLSSAKKYTARPDFISGNIRIKILILIICTLGSLNVQAQSCVLTGKLLDDISGAPIPYANAILTSKKDSTILLGAITDDNGNFIIDGVKPGRYCLTLSFIGYRPVGINDILLNKGKRDVGNIRLQILSENLEAVTIRATRPTITYKVYRKIIYGGSFPGADVAMDLLENIPSLQLDFEGKLTYRGDGTFKVFINGHPVANGEEKLKQIPAERIERIEVITNPSAKYSADGTAGIIQVILKKNRLQGYAISSSAKASTQGAYQWLYSIDQKGERGGWYLEGQDAYYIGNKSSNKEFQEVIMESEVYNTYIDEETQFAAFMNYLEFGFNYDLTGKDYIDFSIYVNPLKCTNENNSKGEIIESIFNNDVLISEEFYSLNSIGYLFYRYLGTTLNYEHSFKKDGSHKLSAYIDYSTYLHALQEQQIDSKIYENRTERVGYKGTEQNEVMVDVNINCKHAVSKNS